MNECCTPENLKVEEVKGDLVIKRCPVCQRRHFELTVDAGQVGSSF